MKAITLYQPWASWIAWGFKTIETRMHGGFRRLVYEIGPIAIHAGKRIDTDAAEIAGAAGWPEAPGLLTELEIPAGAIVALAYVVEHRPMQPSDELAAMCPFEPGRWVVVLRAVHRVDPPVHVRGNRGIWVVPPRVAALAVSRQIGAARSVGAEGDR